MVKVNWSAMKVVMGLVASCCCLSTCTALIDCYECMGDIDSNCGQLNNLADIMKQANSTYCTVSSIGDTIFRSGVKSGEKDFPQYCTDSTCFCNTTNLCNSQKALTPPKISCYVCQSLSFIDNGCGNGEYWKPESPFVRTDKECIACTKSEDGASVSRGCVKSVHTLEGCVRDTGGISCECTEADCNHAPSLLPAYTAITISLIWKIFI